MTFSVPLCHILTQKHGRRNELKGELPGNSYTGQIDSWKREVLGFQGSLLNTHHGKGKRICLVLLQGPLPGSVLVVYSQSPRDICLALPEMSKKSILSCSVLQWDISSLFQGWVVLFVTTGSKWDSEKKLKKPSIRSG